MADMAWVDVEKAIQEGAIALLPTGVIEEHGPHLPLGTDTYSSWLFCALARRCLEARGIKTLIVPPCYWGINQATGAFPGSFTVRPETFKALLLDILSCLKTWGVQSVFILDAHGDPAHEHVIFSATKEAREVLSLDVCVLVEDYKAAMIGLTGEEPYVAVTRTPPLEGPMPDYAEIHAGAIETGMMLEYFPEMVNTDLARGLAPTRLTYDDVPQWQQGGAATREMMPLGYFGAPANYENDRDQVSQYFRALPEMYAEAIAGALSKRKP